MKKIICLLLALLLAVSGMTVAFASGACQIVNQIEDFRNLTMAVAVMNPRTESHLEFTANVDAYGPVPVQVEQTPGGIGHIIVVDIARSYRTSSVNSMDQWIKPLISSFVSQVGQNDMIKVIISSSSGGVGGESNWMPANQWLSYERNLPVSSDTAESRAGDAIARAFSEAGEYTGQVNEPYFKTVLAAVVLASDGSLSGQLSNASNIRRRIQSQLRIDFPVVIAGVYDEAYMGLSSHKYADNVVRGQEEYQSFAGQIGAEFAVVNAAGTEKLNPGTTFNEAIKRLTTQYKCYQLDLRPIHPYIQYAKNEHSLVIAVNGNNAPAIQISSSALPTALPTATPTVAPKTSTPKPTMTPAPTPVVEPDSANSDAFKVIRKLRDLYYLDVKQLPDKFDSSCQYAFQEFCDVNGLSASNSIDNEAFKLLMSDKAIPKPTATPAPTVTPSPVPTVAPKVDIGSNDVSARILISKLQDLYYLDPNVEYSKFDERCMDAYINFCKDNNFDPSTRIDDEMFEFITRSTKAKQTATPVPTATVAALPTIDPRGYTVGSTDEGDNRFITEVQSILQKLNLYSEETEIGKLDNATLNAIRLYCKVYGIKGPGENEFLVSDSLIDNILSEGEKRVPYVAPAPSTSEKFKDTLQREVFKIGSFSVKIWMLAVLILVLILAIALIIVLSKKKDEYSGNVTSAVAPRQKASPDPASSYSGSTSGMSAGSVSRMGRSSSESEETVPPGRGGGSASSDDETLPRSSGISVTISISGGITVGTRQAMITEKNYIIGRNKDMCDLVLEGDGQVSRKQVALNYRGGQLYLYDLSSYGTLVNGQKMAQAPSVSDSSETVPLTASRSGGSGGGFALHRGDVIQAGNYSLTINW